MAGAKVVNPDLQKERRTATFNVEHMTNFIDGGDYNTNRRREIQTRALKEKIFTEGPDVHFLSREEFYGVAVKKSVHLNKLLKEWDLTGPRERQALSTIAFPFETPPDALHSGMFVPTLENQCTDEQKKKWMPKVYSREYIGTYSQTELGHGTHVRGLETLATYDPKTEEFVLHMPTLTAMKWWPGGHGKTTNCAVLMAQLWSQGTYHGIHPFFVIFRDPNNHQPLPGVTVGDIGPKMGYNSIDNGFLKLDQFRIPRENMLMKHAEVLKDGTFVLKTKKGKPTYSTMTMVRTFIVYACGFRDLSAAITIAMRYSAVRRQSELKPGAPEPQILDYQTQQYKLFPYLTMAYAFKFASDKLFEMFITAMGLMHSGDDSAMPELHALSSGLKAYCTAHACTGIEQARLSCGGHGYSQASGLPKIYTQSVPNCTYEGENTVLTLQAARYLMKSYDLVKAGQPVPDSVKYLSKQPRAKSSLTRDLEIEAVINLFEHRSQRIIANTSATVAQARAKGLDEYEARNACGVQFTRAAYAHNEMFVIKAFASAVSNADDPDIKRILSQMLQFLAAYLIVNKSGEFIEDGFLSVDQLKFIKEKEVSLMANIRPNAVALVDSFDHTDHLLGSILGRYDGNVYENLYKWALGSPLNKTQVHESYYKYLQPMMKSKI